MYFVTCIFRFKKYEKMCRFLFSLGKILGKLMTSVSKDGSDHSVTSFDAIVTVLSLEDKTFRGICPRLLYIA